MRKRSWALLAATAAALACLVLLAGCGGGGGSNGTLTVFMADAPLVGVTAVNVTIDRVEAHVDDDWVPVTTQTQTLDLLDLAKQEVILGSTGVPAGHYTQMRLFVSSATVTDADGTWDVKIPSGLQTGIKLNLNFDIAANQITGVLLDFNVSKSIVKLGNGDYHLQPVIPAVVRVLSGTITGTVTLDGAPVKDAAVKAIYTAGANYPLDTEVNTALTAEDGTFKVWALLPGTYRVDVTYTASDQTVKTGTATVEVTANANVDTGPIALASAG